VLADDDVAGRVSDQEQQFATSVFTAAGTHFKAAALDAMPTNYQSMVGAAALSEQRGKKKQRGKQHPQGGLCLWCNSQPPTAGGAACPSPPAASLL
jgi:hypothetical protein